VGVGYFAYTNTIGNVPFYNGRPKGNSVELIGTVQPIGTYIYEYKNTELFARLDTKVGDWPLSIYGQFTRNNEVDEEDSASAIGAKIGSAKEKGQSEFSWTYQEIEADAVIGTFADSDFGGGGTDAKGHVLSGTYAFHKAWSFKATYFINKVNLSSDDSRDYDRLMLDLSFKFK